MAAAAASAGAGDRRPATALRCRLHLRRGLAGLRRARFSGAARGPARLDAEPVSAALPPEPRALSVGDGVAGVLTRDGGTD